MAFKRMRSPALFKRDPLVELTRRLVGEATFQDLDPPVVINSVDINSGMQVLWGLQGLDDVRVADAVLASCALPGYFPPHEIHGRFYADGAVLDNLPVGAAKAVDGTVVIGVDVSASSAFRADTQDEGFVAVFARATELAMQSEFELRMRLWTTPPLYLVHPRVEHISLFSFDHIREMVEEGYRRGRSVSAAARAGAGRARSLHRLRRVPGAGAAGDVRARRAGQGGGDATAAGVEPHRRLVHPALPDVRDQRAGGSGRRNSASIRMKSRPTRSQL